jgi:NDP-sugar pyrophosphorylase family protein
MADHKVLITTSGIGSRLGKLTDFTNKSLVRVGDKPAISHIIEYYPKDTSFVITLGHFGSYVKEFLELAYSNRNFTFINVDNFKGPGSSLGHSILQAKSELQCPFIFHASDTILTSLDVIPNLEHNWCAGAYKEETSQYRTLRTNNGWVDIIAEKGEINFDYPYIGLCGIKDYILFWECLESLPNNHSLSDVHVINKMLDVVTFNFHKINNWLDIGNTTELNKTREYFGSSIKVLDKNNESIYFFNDFVIKFFSDKNINKNRIERASMLNGLVPDILGSTQNFYKYKKAEGDLFAKSVNESTFNSFLNWAEDNLWKLKTTDDFNQKCFEFYILKTNKRINQYLEKKPDTSEVINGELIPPIEDILSRIDVKWLCDGIPVQFHGDFILDNIIETKDNFCLIDWRQDFAGDLEVGDIYYDLAKLNHNLIINHDIVDKKLFNSSPENCYILCNSTLLKCKDLLHKFIIEKGYDLKKVEILSSIIWINMAPLHEYPFNKFLFNFGKYNLYKSLNVS